MKLFLVLTLAYISAAAQQPKTTIIPPHLDYYLTAKDPSRYAIFKFEAKRDSFIFGDNVRSALLSASEIATIEQLITQKVAAYNQNRKNRYDIIKKSRKYYKQFIAVINAKGEKEVWVNCSCGVMREYWKIRIQTTNDGGSCYFRIRINLTKGAVTDFDVNGLA
jgi:hypothetical protein